MAAYTSSSVGMFRAMGRTSIYEQDKVSTAKKIYRYVNCYE